MRFSMANSPEKQKSDKLQLATRGVTLQITLIFLYIILYTYNNWKQKVSITRNLEKNRGILETLEKVSA